jgi:purine-binding chemotaxis protein CheW
MSSVPLHEVFHSQRKPALALCGAAVLLDLRFPASASRRAAMISGSRNAASAEGTSRRTENPIIQLVGFRLDNEDYAIAITKIQEIILMKPITRIPQVPDFIEGLINLRGSVIPIVNLRKRFGLSPREVDDETRTIVVNIHDKTVGCIVDAVTQVMRINRDQIQPPPLSVLAVSHQYIAGLARLEDRLLIILDIDRLFDEQSSMVSGQWSEKSGEQPA